MIIGVTGGVGSGKSTAISHVSELYDALVLRTDDIAKELMTDPKLLEQLEAAMGRSIRDRDGLLDKKLYGDLIYSSERMAAISDSIVHPAVWDYVRERAGEESSKGRLVLVESALPGKELSDICDHILVLTAGDRARLSRLAKERGYSSERYEDIKERQLSQEAFEALGDVIIRNDGTIEEMKKRTEEAIDDLCKSCQRKQR